VYEETAKPDKLRKLLKGGVGKINEKYIHCSQRRGEGKKVSD